MGNLQSFIRGTTADNFDKILCSIIRTENKDWEIVFPSDMIECISKEYRYPCYRFAHNLEEHTYWRVRIKNITLEYAIIPSVHSSDYNAYVLQIFQNGQLIYKKPRCSDGTIHIIWPNVDE